MRSVKSIALVDDDIDVLDAVGETLTRGGYRVRKFHGAGGVIEALSDDWPGIVLTDMRMPKVTGIELLERMRAHHPSVPVILFSAHGDVAAATKIMQLGAEDFIEKPIEPELLIEVVARAIEKRRLMLLNVDLMERLSSTTGLAQSLPGTSAKMRSFRKQVEQVASSSLNVLITGEYGLPHVACAHEIHVHGSPQSDEIIEVNARLVGGTGGLQESLIHVHPSGEDERQTTVIIHHIEALDQHGQSMLMTIATQKRIKLIGTFEGDLETLQANEQILPVFLVFLSGMHLEIPTLRSRKEDILPLVTRSLRRITQQRGSDEVHLDEKTKQALKSYGWPGNMREIENVAERLCAGLDLQLLFQSQGTPLEIEDYQSAMARFERSLIESVLNATGGRKKLAAERLGVPRKRLYLRMKTLGISD